MDDKDYLVQRFIRKSQENSDDIKNLKASDLAQTKVLGGFKSSVSQLEEYTSQIFDNIDSLNKTKIDNSDKRLSDARKSLPHNHPIKDIIDLEKRLGELKNGLGEIYKKDEVEKKIKGILSSSDEKLENQRGELRNQVVTLYSKFDGIDQQFINFAREVKSLKDKPDTQDQIFPVIRGYATEISKINNEIAGLNKQIKDFTNGKIDIEKIENKLFDKVSKSVKTTEQITFVTRNGIQNLSQLKDVDIDTPTDGQTLVYDSVTGMWVNGSGGGGTPSAPDMSIQYNNAGAFYGDALATRDPTTLETTIAGNAFAIADIDTVENNTVTFNADFPGYAGNTITIVSNGIDDLDTMVAAWNVPNPLNTVSFSGAPGTDTLSVGSYTLVGGGFVSFIIGTPIPGLITSGAAFVFDDGTGNHIASGAGNIGSGQSAFLAWSDAANVTPNFVQASSAGVDVFSVDFNNNIFAQFQADVAGNQNIKMLYNTPTSVSGFAAGDGFLNIANVAAIWFWATTDGANGDVLTTDGTGNLSFQTPTPAGVTSFNTLTGDVTISAGANITLTPIGNDIEIASTGSGTPASPDGGIQYNTGGAFDADSLATRDATTQETTIGRDTIAVWNTATDQVNEITFNADNVGLGGNTINLVWVGTDTVDNVVNAWNTANPLETVSFVGAPGTDTLTDKNITLAGGGIQELFVGEVVPGILTGAGSQYIDGVGVVFNGIGNIGRGAASLQIAVDTGSTQSINFVTYEGVRLNFDDQIAGNTSTVDLDTVSAVIGFLEGGTNKTSMIQLMGTSLVITNNDIVWNWPTADGSLNDVLTTDGAGTLSWSAGGGGTLTSTYVGFGSGTNTLTGDADFTWNNTNKTFKVADLVGNDTAILLDNVTNLLVFNNTGYTAIGDYNHSNNQTTVSLNDDTGVVSIDGFRDVTESSIVFTGAGLDDLNIRHDVPTNAPQYFYGASGTTYEVVIDAVDVRFLSYTNLVGGSFNIGDTITGSPSGATGVILADEYTTPNGFMRLDTNTGDFTGDSTISNGLGQSADFFSVTPPGSEFDTYELIRDAVSIGSYQAVSSDPTFSALGFGVWVDWSATTGHTVGNSWAWSYTIGTYGLMANFDGSSRILTIGDVEEVSGKTRFQIDDNQLAVWAITEGGFGVKNDAGTFSFQVSTTTDAVKVNGLAGGGTQYVTVDNDGILDVGATPAPALTATYVGFGSGANLLTGSANMIWDNTNFAFSVGDLGVAVNGIKFLLNDSTKLITLGDPSDLSQGLYLKINNTTNKFNIFSDYNSVADSNLLEIDGNLGRFKFGDISNSNLHSVMFVDDASELLTFSSDTLTTLYCDPSFQAIGDVFFDLAGTGIYIDQASDVITNYGGIAFATMQVYTSTGNVTISDGQRGLYYDPASLNATATITLPANPEDGQEILILFGGTITGAGTAVVTTLTIAANAGQTLIGTYPIVATTDTVIIAKFRDSTNQWYRID